MSCRKKIRILQLIFKRGRETEREMEGGWKEKRGGKNGRATVMELALLWQLIGMLLVGLAASNFRPVVSRRVGVCGWTPDVCVCARCICTCACIVAICVDARTCGYHC